MNSNGFVAEFREWLGPEPEKTIPPLARRSGYTIKYIEWAAGFRGNVPWPGTRRFRAKMRALGCGKCWRDRTPEQLRWAFETRQEL